MVCHYTLLFDIINYYDTIMTLIAIIAISALCLLFSVGEVGIFWARKCGYGQHTEGIILAKNPSGLITSSGHWHGLVVPGMPTYLCIPPGGGGLPVGIRQTSPTSLHTTPPSDPGWSGVERSGVVVGWWGVGVGCVGCGGGVCTRCSNRRAVSAIFRQWPNRCQLQRNWN